MRIRRFFLTGGLVLALLLVGAPFHAVIAVEASPEVVTADLEVDATELHEVVAGRRTEVIDAPITFTGLWVRVDADIDALQVRTSADGERWTPWATVGTVDANDGPDPHSPEAAGAADVVQLRRTSELLLTDESRQLQLQVPEQVGGIQVHLADASGANDSIWVRAARLLTGPGVQPASASENRNGVPEWVIGRDVWGANEQATGSVKAADEVKLTVVHHTATKNDYTREEVPQQLRIIQNYHIGLGWDDIGYNAVVDRFGRVYEGRKGGLDRGIIGAHASGFNTGSFGVAVLGNYTGQRASQVVVDALADIISYKSVRHGFDPEATVTFNGRSRPVVVGHQDVGNTLCPGRIQEQLGDIQALANLRTEGYGPFGDITAANTHGKQVLRLYHHGVIAGCRPFQFCPGDDLTREQAATLVSRALALPPADGSVFLDVQANATHETHIGAVAAQGIMHGYADGRFGRQDPLTREQMASLLARAMELTPVDDLRFEGQGFEDVSFSSVHGGNVYAIAEAGITQGCRRGPTSFCPKDHITRAQMASFVDAMLERLGHFNEDPVREDRAR